MIDADEFTGTGELPDALAFVKPNRARCYVAVDRADGLISARELTDELGCSITTAYRCLNDLQDLGLVTDSICVGPDERPKTGYATVSTDTSQPVRADGGTDR
ncbi:helix-turn-helix domain-containing protein [Natrialba aegyptia]|uniref:HTH iclR-type domain-containing protein n=1 Tax=Natrialba aegyptia DSM 13077 TaxID=1227491 RepID=M0B5H1_9EURY|nr:HTH domain-containing protein [Natrialba aegyptia]ELZ05787.1 hypothetical protein C480_10330 [Natrialba aegyptia DSM 13077]